MRPEAAEDLLHHQIVGHLLVQLVVEPVHQPPRLGSLGRAAGETAPIMFTAAAFYAPDLPSSVFHEVMALPYHIYVMATAGIHIQETRHLQYGTAIVLIMLVLLLNSVGLMLRYRFRKKLKG